MPATLDRKKKVWVVRLEGETNVACAADFKTLLLEALASGKELQLDLANAIDLDVTALQLLWAAEREAKASGKSLVLAGPLPEAMAEIARETGLEKFPVSARAH